MHSLLSSDPTVGETNTAEKVVLDQVNLKMNVPVAGGNEGTGTSLENSNEGFDDRADLRLKFNTSREANKFPIKEIPVEGQVHESDSGLGPSTDRSSDNGCIVRHTGPADCQSGDDNCQAVILPSFDNLQVDRTISKLHGSKKNKYFCPVPSGLENSIAWLWTPFPEMRQMDIKNFLKLCLQKFECISSYTPEYIPTAYQLISEEGSRLHIPVETDDYIVSDYEGELSSIIACALASLEDRHVALEVLDEDRRRGNGMVAKSFDSLQSLGRNSNVSSPHWSSNGFSDSDSGHSTPSISSDDSRFSSFDGLNLLESLVPLEPFSPVISLPGKGKYSVACIYANEFRDLRSRCCSSEVDYIASLSRCRNWDAKGGKSKSFFAKTLDDRFIVKEIKKTEFDSFMKFARDYFKYMNQSFELGNQTCLAKVLGIYQVCWIDFSHFMDLVSLFLASEYFCR